MRNLIAPLVLLTCAVCGTAIAFPATQLEINCIPSNIPPVSTACFNETVGRPFTFWVIAQDAGHGAATNYTGTVHITSSDPTATLPPDYTFTAADNGIAPFVMTFHSVTTANIPSQETVVATDSGNGISEFQYFAVFEPAATTSAAPALDAISMAILIGSLALLGGLALKAAIAASLAARRMEI